MISDDFQPGFLAENLHGLWYHINVFAITITNYFFDTSIYYLTGAYPS